MQMSILWREECYEMFLALVSNDVPDIATDIVFAREEFGRMRTVTGFEKKSVN
jgi:hypothetical protein